MIFKYCIKKFSNGTYLNNSGGWSQTIFAWNVKFFDTEEAATAAFVDGVKCTVARIQKGN